MLDKDNILILFERDFIKMEKVKVRLLTPVIDNGKIKQAGDVIEVDKQLAKEIVARKRATYNLDVQPVNIEPKKDNGEPLDLDKLRAIADELEIKYNQNIGAQKLEAKILAVLEKAEDDGLTFREDLPILEAYKLYKAEKAKKEAGGNDKDKIPVDRLEEIAKAAKIEIAQDVEEDGLQDFIEVELEQYAGELGIEIAEDDNAETLWAKIQEKLKGKDE